MWKNGPAARRLPAHHRGQRRTGGRKEEPPLVPESFKVFIPAAVYLQRGRCAGVGRCPAPGHPWCQLQRGRERANPWLFAASGGSNCLSSAPPSGIAVLLSDTSSASQGPTNAVSIPLALLFTPWGPADMFSLPSTITVIAPVRPSQVFFFFFFSPL